MSNENKPFSSAGGLSEADLDSLLGETRNPIEEESEGATVINLHANKKKRADFLNLGSPRAILFGMCGACGYSTTTVDNRCTYCNSVKDWSKAKELFLPRKSY